ncbi:hypothetical protein D9611_003174 [Ephemerocybe angulata]|uniref:Uncharacterized protein n=1 Tax=Ephemerocybe angulata TaxID=980116 RepID=A0A8H5C8H1_9AGAR|nr:hypothetical protein D9611_003174 [Tulosesus angulatus]
MSAPLPPSIQCDSPSSSTPLDRSSSNTIGETPSTGDRTNGPRSKPAVTQPSDTYQSDEKAFASMVASPSSASKYSLASQPTDLSTDRFTRRIASGYFAYFMCGWGDGVMATVLPRLMADFGITFMTGSLFYVASTVGFLTGTLLLEVVLKQLGQVEQSSTRSAWLPYIPLFQKSPARFSAVQARHLVGIVCTIMHFVFFTLMGTRGGFPAIFMAHVISTVGRSILTASLNKYFIIVPKHVGYAFALWSFGAVVAPLVCQALMAKGVPWYQFYLGSLVAAALNIIFFTIAFRPTDAEFGFEKIERDTVKSPPLSATSTIVEGEPFKVEAPNTLRLALTQPFQWAMSIFAALYYGSETNSQGFMVAYLLQVRTLSSSAKMDCRGLPVYVFARYKLLEIKLILPSDKLDNAAAHLVPVLSLASDILPKEVEMVGMALISCASSIGAALFPFITGVILNERGAQNLPYVNVALTGTVCCYWACLPTKKRALATTGIKV